MLASKPIAYYKLDDSGSVAYDSSTNGLNGTVGSGVAKGVTGLLTSTSDAAMRFPGTRSTSGVVMVPPNAKFKVSSQLTMELLLRFATVPATYTVPLSYGTDTYYAPYDVYFVNGHFDAQFYLSTGVLVVSSPSQLQPNVTYHVVATYNGATATLYLNGIAVASKSKTGTFIGYDNTHGFAIGDDAGFSDPGFAGTVDGVAIYGTPLTASQVQAHYAAAKSSSTPAPTATPLTAASPTPTLAPTPKPTVAPTAAPTSQPATSGNVATFAGCRVFTAGDWYNAPVTSAAMDPNSSSYISGNYAAGNRSGVQMYFPSHEYVNVATSATPMLTVHPLAWSSAFSGVPWPWASNFQIENAPSDQHAMVVDTANCTLYESYDTTYSSGVLSAYSGWHWNLSQPFQALPKDEPSSMASGLSFFAGMVKWEEVAAGSVNHALNIALPAGTLCYRCYVTPASSTESYAFKGTSSYQLPYGAHLRLKSSVNISGFSPQAQIILRAMQTYGVYIADTGCCMEMYDATPPDGNNAHWDAAGINAALGSLRITNFDVLTVPSIQHY